MPVLHRAVVCCVAACCTISAVGSAQDSDGAPRGRGCSAPEHRQFDFWIGDWEVSTADGAVAGRNRIESILDGCALKESWTGVKGGSGTSYNAWDRQRGRWHQTWVDDGGLVLRLEGGYADGRMVLSGETLDSVGRVVLNRITWQETGPAALRQLWQTSSDGGRTWGVVFDGRYRKRE
ncbi:MAG TPA: hypothetical protein VHG35_10100 [Gemmatimonadales bacterium]|nr:hypothetical protein [Gemmatimonadales bacterium]